MLKIKGVEKLGGTSHSVLPDMIEIGSWIGLAAMTKSNIRIKDVSWENLGVIPNVFRSMGIKLIKENDDIANSLNIYGLSRFLTIDFPGLKKSLITASLLTAMSIPALAEDVKIGVPSWTGAQAMAHLLGAVVEMRIGGTVDYVPGNNATIFQGMDQGKGDIDVHPDVWLPNQESFTKKYVEINADYRS